MIQSDLFSKDLSVVNASISKLSMEEKQTLLQNISLKSVKTKSKLFPDLRELDFPQDHPLYTSVYGQHVLFSLLRERGDLDEIDAIRLRNASSKEQKLFSPTFSAFANLPNLKKIDCKDADCPSDYEVLRTCPNLTHLYLHSTKLESLDVFNDFSQLKVLEIYRNPNLKTINLHSLPSLWLLTLSRTEQVDAVLALPSTLTKLTLRGSQSDFFDKGLQVLSKLPKLNTVIIDFPNTPATNLTPLSTLPPLTHFTLECSSISDDQYRNIPLAEVVILDFEKSTISSLVQLEHLSTSKQISIKGNSSEQDILPPFRMEGISQLTNLEALKVSYRWIDNLRPLPENSKLQKLPYHNPSDAVPFDISYLLHKKDEKKIVIDGNNAENFYTLSNHLTEFAHVEEMYISGYHDFYPPPELGQLHTLKKLVINSRCTHLPNEIEKLTNLEYLKIQWSSPGYSESARIIDDVFANLSSLKTLVIEDASTLPPSFETLETLEKLVLNSYRGSRLPNLSQLKNLKHIEVTRAEELCEFPIGINHCTALETIIITRTKIESVSDLSDLKSLKKLQLTNGKITNFPIGLSETLEEVNLSNNNITTLPLPENFPSQAKLNMSENPVIADRNVRVLWKSAIGEKFYMPWNWSKFDTMLDDPLKQTSADFTDDIYPEVLPVEFAELRELTKVSLKTTKFPDSWKKVEEVEFEPEKDVPSTVYRDFLNCYLAKSAKILSIKLNTSETLEEFSQWTTLEELEFGYGSTFGTNVFPSDLSSMKALRKIKMWGFPEKPSSSEMDLFVQALSSLPNLRELNLVNFEGTTITSEYFSLSTLEKLTIHGGSVNLHDSFVKWTNLQNIHFDIDTVSNLEILAKMPNLKEVTLEERGWTKVLFETFEKRQKIRDEITHCSISFGSEFDEVDQLRLDGGASFLAEKGDENSTSISLAGSQFTEFPKGLRKWTKLKEIRLGIHLFAESKIQTLPDWIGEFTDLEHLDLDTSSVSELPDSMVELKNLKKLFLDRSNVAVLPDWLDQLQSLTTLGLGGSDVAEVPAILGKCKTITKVMLYSERSDFGRSSCPLARSQEKIEQLRMLMPWAEIVE